MSEVNIVGGHGHRHMYYATGLPGWVRFGYSPGWGGLPPAAQYLRDTGQLDAFLDTLPTSGPYGGQGPSDTGGLSRDEQVAALSARMAALQRSLNDMARHIETLGEEAAPGDE